ncbi:lysozyme [Kushneria aurantia]|uniref:Lysozyme n=1 Tax=Kushneria aurantia TaxID=504092 RepID=A0ABV6G4J5_9GAMM|nr:lysozyme [Kushneria aurantia]
MRVGRKTIASVVGGGTLAIAAAIVSPWEGTRLESYQDSVGVWTVCTGHTATAAPGQTRTPEACRDLLESDLGAALAAVNRHVEYPISNMTRAALVSFAYNVGEGAFERSTLLEKLNAGDVRGACNELPKWVYAGGQRLRGLAKRRANERQVCLDGIERPSVVYSDGWTARLQLEVSP